MVGVDFGMPCLHAELLILLKILFVTFVFFMLIVVDK